MVRRLAFLAVSALLPATEAGQCSIPLDGEFPSCRKSPIVRVLATSDVLGVNQDVLMLFGGKGLDLKHKKHHKKKVKEEIEYLGDTWIYDINGTCWSDPETVDIENLPMVGKHHGRRRRKQKDDDDEDGPKGRWKAEAVVLSNGRDMVLFGGCTKAGASNSQNDLWVFRAGREDPVEGSTFQGAWREVESANPPARRRGHVVAANSSHMVIMGGKNDDKQCVSDLWLLPLTALDEDREGGAPVWTQGADFPGPCRWGMSGELMSGPSGQDLLAVFGGRKETDGVYTYYNEVWLYDFAADSWALANVSGVLPQPRDHHGFAKVDNKLVIFGGRVKATRDPDAILADVWSFALLDEWHGQWTQWWGGGEGGPTPRYMPGVTAYPVRSHVPGIIVFGGMTLGDDGIKESLYNDLWTFTVPGGWQRRDETRSCPKPKKAKELSEDEEKEQQQLAARGWVWVPAAVAAVAIVCGIPLNNARLARARETEDHRTYFLMA